MSVQKRRCVTCKHFDDAKMAGNGWCTHPKRQVSNDVRILVRKGELACRNSWGGDLWVSAESERSVPDPAPVVPERAFIANEHTEDQVTSVRSTGGDRSTSDRVVSSEPSFRDGENEDIIVDQASVLPEDSRQSPPPERPRYPTEDDGLNVPAQEDQQERARVIARGSRDAILRARERHTQRRKGLDRLQPPPRQDDEVTHPDLPVSGPSDDQVSFSTSIESDPIAEDQGVIGQANPRFRHRSRNNDDASVESNPERARSTQVTRTYADPTPPVPTDDVHDDPHNIVSRRSDRDRFETVPEIKPDIELPRIREFLQAGEDSPSGDGTADDGGGGPAPLNSYDMVLRRAQAIKTASRVERRGSQSRPMRATAATSRVSSHPVERPDIERTRTNRANHLPSIEWDLEPENADVSFTGAQLPDLDSEEIVSGRQERHEPEMAFEDVGAQTAWAEGHAWRDDEYADLDVDPGTYPRRSERAEHAWSWWRSLNFGRGRQQPDRVSASDDIGEYEPEEWHVVVDGDGEFDDIAAYFDDEPEAVAQQPAFVEQPGFEAERPSSRVGRRQLVWEPFNEIVDAPVSAETFDLASSEQARAADEGRHLDAPKFDRPARRSVRADSSGFPLNDEQGMDAFRSALFGNEGNGRRVEMASVGLSRELEREPVVTHRRTAVGSPARESRRSEFEPLDECPQPAIITEPRRDGRWEKPRHDAGFDIRDFIERQDDLLDMSIALAPDLPRICQTCRDFRPSESGERGWCTNDWAFTHRQMVNAESLPCQSSIGCWWLPNDASWLPAFDPAERRGPTPRTDRLVARSRPDRLLGDQEYPGLYVREM